MAKAATAPSATTNEPTTTASNAEPASQEAPSVLTELGLGNNLKPATTEEAAHEPASTDAPVVEAVAAEAAPAPVSEPKPAAKAEEPPKAEKADDKAEYTRLTKQLKDLRDTWTQERQLTKEAQKQIQTISQQLAVLTKKFDGTYDETRDAPKEDPPQVVADKAAQSERIKTSHWAAVDHYGEEYVMKTVWAEDAPFRQFDQDPAVQARVFNARLPILEAIKVVKETEAKAKYGADPEAMRQAIEKEVRADLEKEVRQQVLKEFKAKGGGLDTVKGLGGVPSATEAHAPAEKRLEFESLFPGFQKTAG